ncbi:hypothetical protein BGW37DRAFT_520248 [Umbelopsis sp. PMI_123]|nr:hypothetical protein BGW37DRAFT_520248 [Umbelopsis sp. PMI_123]
MTTVIADAKSEDFCADKSKDDIIGKTMSDANTEGWNVIDRIESGQNPTITPVSHIRVWTKWLFFLGFLCPVLWVIGSRLSLKDCNSQAGFIWKKRCRIAVTIMLTLGIVGSVLIMIFNPQAFGLRKNTAAGPQTSSNSNSALRPDVPVNGTSTTGDILAGIIVAGQKV